MKPLAFIFALYVLLLSSCSIPTTTTETEDKDSTYIGAVLRKPNIYLYPKKLVNLTITIEFPNGGYLMQTIPQYQDGWHVTVEPNGLINNRYRFLFYEGRAPDRYQYQAGWVVAGDSLFAFFSNNLKASGFSEAEIKDFIDYWIPILESDTSYAIYPQYQKDLEPIVRLKFSIPPTNLRRLIYVLRECPSTFQIKQRPVIPAFKREGFYVIEWGVVLQESNKPFDHF